MKNFLIVFDINNTLLLKIKKSDKLTLSKLSKEQLGSLETCNKHFLLKRQHTDILVKFLDTHELDYVFWSASKRCNVRKMVNYLRCIGYNNNLGFLGQEDCKAGGEYKDLKLVAKQYDKHIDNCVLVDDSIGKHVEGQNYIHIDHINFTNESEFFLLCKKIDNFINCSATCFVKNL